MTTATRAVDRTQLPARDRELIASYSEAMKPHIDTMTRAQRHPGFSSGISAHAQATALTRWWTALGKLAEQLTPGNTEARRYLDDQLRQWFTAQRAALYACLDYAERHGILGTPTIPRPEDLNTGHIRLGEVLGHVGYRPVDQRITVTEPIEVRLTVTPDGTVNLHRDDQ